VSAMTTIFLDKMLLSWFILSSLHTFITMYLQLVLFRIYAKDI